jgi:hypothetical protein
VDHALQAGDVVRVAHRFGQLEHPHEHRGDELAVRDAVALDALERALGVELLHHDRGAAKRLHRHRPKRRRGVVKRRRIQIYRLAGDSDGVQQRHHDVGRLGRREVRKLAADPLRPPGGARRILQQVTFDLVGDRRRGLTGNAFRVARPAIEVIVGDHQEFGQSVGEVPTDALAHRAHRA